MALSEVKDYAYQLSMRGGKTPNPPKCLRAPPPKGIKLTTKINHKFLALLRQGLEVEYFEDSSNLSKKSIRVMQVDEGCQYLRISDSKKKAKMITITLADINDVASESEKTLRITSNAEPDICLGVVTTRGRDLMVSSR